jgi:hypothetical protein
MATFGHRHSVDYTVISVQYDFIANVIASSSTTLAHLL